MTVVVEIADRQYDYTDEEKATAAVANFQEETGLSDEQIIALWSDTYSKHRAELEGVIFDAVEVNGGTRRSRETVPAGVSLFIESDSA